MTGRHPPVRSLVQFARERGLVTEYEVLSHIHAGLRSAPTTKTYQRWNERRTAELQAAATETSRLYREAIEREEIQAPAKPTLKERAAGHPDLVSTQAAKRLLEKRRARAAIAKATGAA